ncbi:MAG: ribosome maturation factor RimP [Clostridia bacterium]
MKKNIAALTRELIELPLTTAGFSIWDVKYEKEGGDYILCIELDKEGGMSIDDCSVANDIINPIIDNADLIEIGYCLEVSSAGLTRELRNLSHFQYAIDKQPDAEIKVFTAIDGKKQFFGKITYADENEIEINSVKINKKNIAKAVAAFE